MATKTTLYITKFKIPTERDSNGEYIAPNIQISDDMLINSEPITFEVDEVQVKLPEIAKSLSKFNARQITIFNSSKTLDYTYKKIIRKHK